VIAGFVATLTRREPEDWLLGVQVVALVVVLYGATSIIEQVPSLNVTWRHAGVTDEIMRSGAVDRGIDAYFNWPGAFVLMGLATDLAGADTAVELASWAPVVLNLAYLPPLMMLARAATNDRRLAWAAVWCFFLGNWVYQDYLSPQGLTYVLYLGVLAVTLTWFAAPGGRRLRPRSLERIAERWSAGDEQRRTPAPALGRRRRAALAIAIALVVAAAVPSHQLTPFALLLALGGLVLMRRTQLTRLPLVAFVLITAWLLFATGPYLSGHLEQVTSGVGDLAGTFTENVGARVAGSDDHRIVVLVRIALAAVLWTAALAGAIRMAGGRGLRPPHSVLLAAPFALALLQPYGGEVLLRIYLFTLPFVGLLVMSIVRPRPSLRSGLVLGAVSVVLVAGFLVARYGNAQALLFTPDEVATVQRVSHDAPSSALIVAPNPNLPWQAVRYGDLKWRTLRQMDPAPEGDSARVPGPALAARVAAFMAADGPPAAYLVFTRSVRGYERLLGSDDWGTVPVLEAAVRRSSLFRRVRVSRDAEVFRLVDPSGPS
jgi:hypothetical protein